MEPAAKSERAEMREHALLDESMSVLTESVSSSEESIHDQHGSDADEEEEGDAPPLPGTAAFDNIVNNLLEFSQEESRDSSEEQDAAGDDNDNEEDGEDDEFHVTKIRKAISDAARRYGPVVILADLEAIQQTSRLVCRRDRNKQLWWRYHLLHSLPDEVNIMEYFASINVQEQKLIVEKSQSLLAGEFPGCVEVSGDSSRLDITLNSSPDTSREEAEEEEDGAKCSGQVDSPPSPNDVSNLDHGDDASSEKVSVDPLCFTGESTVAYKSSEAEPVVADHDGDTTSYATARMFEEDHMVVVSSQSTAPDMQFKITAHNGGEFVYETGLEVHSPSLSVDNKQEDCINVTSETPMLALELRSKFTEEEDDVFSEADQCLTVTATKQDDGGGGIHLIPVVDEPSTQNHQEPCMLQPLVTADKDMASSSCSVPVSISALNQETPESLNGTTDGGFLQLLFDKDNNSAVCSPAVVMEQTLDENSMNALTQPGDVPSDALDEGVEVDEIDYHQHHNHSDANEKSSVDNQDVAVEIVSPDEEIADAQALPCSDEHEQEPVLGSGHVVTELNLEPLLGDVEAQTLKNESIACNSTVKEITVAPTALEAADDKQVHPIAKDEQDVVAEADLVVIEARQDQVLELPYGGVDQENSDNKQTHGTDVALCLVNEESQDVPEAFDSTDEQIRLIDKDEHKVEVETVNSFSSTEEQIQAIVENEHKLVDEVKMVDEHKVIVETVNSFDSMDDEIHPIEHKVVVEAVNPVGQLDEGIVQEPQLGLKGDGEDTTPHEASTHNSENDENRDAPAPSTGDATQVELSDNKGENLVAETISAIGCEALQVSIEGDDAQLEEPAGSMVSVDIDPTNDLWLGSFSNSMPQVASSSTKEHELVQDDGNVVENKTLDVDIQHRSKSTNGAWLGSFHNCMPQVDPEEELVAESRRPDAEFDEISDIDDASHNFGNEKIINGAAKYFPSDEKIDPFTKLEDEFLMEIVGPSMENSSFRPVVAEKRDSPATEYTKQPNTSDVQVQEHMAHEKVVAAGHGAPALVCKEVALADLLLLEDADGPQVVDKQPANETVISPPGHTDHTHNLVESPTPDQNKQVVAAEIGSPGSAFEKKYISLPIPEADGDAAKQEFSFVELPSKEQEVAAEVGVVNLAYATTTKVVEGKVDPQLLLPQDQVGPAYGQGKSIQTVSETILIDFNEKLASSSQRLLHAEFLQLNLCCDTTSEVITDDDEIKQNSAPSEPTQKPVNEDKTVSRPSSPKESTPSEEKACDTPKRASDVTPKPFSDDKDDQAQKNAGASDSEEQVVMPDNVPDDGLEPDKTIKVDDAKVGEPPMEVATDSVASVLDTDEIREAQADPSTETAVDKSVEPVRDTKDHGENNIAAAMEATNDTLVDYVTLKPIAKDEILPPVMEGKEKLQQITEKSTQKDKAGSDSSDEKRFILKPTTEDSHHTPIVQSTLDAFDTVKLLGPALQKDESAKDSSLPSAPKNAEQPGDSKARITKQYTQCLFQHPPSSDVVILPSVASTDSEVTSSSDEGERCSDVRASRKRGVMVDYKNNKYRGFVVVLHERHGVMLMHSSGIKRDEASQHWQLPGGQVHDCEFIEAARYTNDKRSQIALAAKACAARELFDQTGLDFRFKLGRLVPAGLRPQPSKQNKKPVNELKHRYFFVLRLKDDEFPSQGHRPTGAVGNDLMITLSSQHSEFTFQPEPSEAANMVKLQSAGKCAEALNIVMCPSKQDMLGKAVVPLQPDQNDIGMVAEISDFLAKACFCF